MDITVQGKQISVGDALRTHVESKLEELNEKYLNHGTFATVTFSREGHSHGLIRAHIHLSVGKNILVMADAMEGDPYVSFDTAAERVAKQLRRYKRRLKDHHGRLEEDDMVAARDYVLAPDDKEEDADHAAGAEDAPVVVAEMSTAIQTMSVSDAVMRLDLSGQPALLFRNPAHNGLNMVYRRGDGHIGWVDPEAARANTNAKPAEAKKAAKTRRA